MLEHQNIKNAFAKSYTPDFSEKVFVVKKVKNTVLWTYVINELNGKEIVGTFYEKQLQKTNQNNCRTERVIRKNGDKSYFK